MNVEVRRIHPTDAKKIRHLQRWWLPHPEALIGRYRADQSGCGRVARGLDGWR